MTPELLQRYLDVIGNWIVSGVWLAFAILLLLVLLGVIDKD